MRLTTIRLHNWLRFRGVHALHLDATVYAVVARWDGDAERSNWAGKSALLWAVRFALYGKHPADTEDDWITRGEDAGGVTLDLDDGTRVERLRNRGKSTRLRVTTGADSAVPVFLNGDEAQRKLDELVGLADGDFATVAWFEQKQLARFVTSTAGDRLKVVRAWLGLDPLYRTRDRVAAQLRAALKDEGAVEAKLQQEAARFQATLAGAQLTDAVREGHDAIDYPTRLQAQAEREAEEARAEADEHERHRAQVAFDQRDRRDAARHAEVARELAALPKRRRSQAAGGAEAEQRAVAAARVDVQTASADVRRLKQLALGQFDGACPLLAGLACPATGQINGARQAHRAAAKQREADLSRASLAADVAEEALATASRAATEAAQQEGREEALRAELLRLAPAAERAAALGPEGELPDYRALAGAALSRAATVEARAKELARARAALASIAEQRAKLAGEQAALRGRRVAHQEALAALALARRSIADRALTDIVARANGVLADAGVDLTLSVSWMREVKGQLATACDACGTPFPASQRVKACEACGAPRGLKLNEELELVLSARSGAADDLAGLAFCLAAGAWLRAERGSGWSVAFLDEPFGFLDTAHRRRIASHLAAMLASRHGFTQALVVAHQAGVMDGLPGRVEVVAGPASSRVEVVV